VEGSKGSTNVSIEVKGSKYGTAFGRNLGNENRQSDATLSSSFLLGRSIYLVDNV
jgi:hypothetical protein